jgi:hypothetical protein
MRHREPFAPKHGDHKEIGCTPAAYVRGCIVYYEGLLKGTIAEFEAAELRAGRPFIAKATFMSSVSSSAEYGSADDRKEVASIVGNLLGRIDAAISAFDRKSQSKTTAKSKALDLATILNLC